MGDLNEPDAGLGQREVPVLGVEGAKAAFKGRLRRVLLGKASISASPEAMAFSVEASISWTVFSKGGTRISEWKGAAAAWKSATVRRVSAGRRRGEERAAHSATAG